MAPNRTSIQRSFNTSLLEFDVLAAPGGLETALGSIERACYHDDSSIMEMIVGLNNHPHILEYTFSILDDQAYERLSKWTVARFPTSATPNVMEALGIKLLQRLSSSLTSIEGVSTAEHRAEFRVFRRKVGLSLNVLKELGGCTDRASVDANVSPVGRKRSKTLARRTQLDPHPFDCMGIAVPTKEDEVHAVCGDILPQLQSILGRYLLVLRRPLVSDIFKRQLEDLGITAAPPMPIVQSTTTLRFEKAEGFGEWQILLSTKAQKYLREARRGNGTMFKIVVKKIKELSQGHFSDDNQKKLTGKKTIIPVYEAKMTGNTRLVYHIDCTPDGEGETQAIRVFGVYTHAKMDHGGFWDTLSRQLQNKGPDYVARCTFRNKPMNTGDNVIPPASFPRSPTKEVQEITPLANVCEEDQKNLMMAARVSCPKDEKVKKAQRLSPSEDEAITFAEDYGFDEAYVGLFHTLGMAFGSAEVLANGGRMADAVKTLIAAPRAPDPTRRAVEYLLTGLWRRQSFGVDHPTTNSDAVSELLTLADTLRDNMHEQEAQEVAMFRARHKADFKTLRILHPKFIGVENYSAALLCLDPIFTSTLPQQGEPTVDPEPQISFHFDYFKLLDFLRREDRLYAGSVLQKVFAFQPRQDDRFFIPVNTFLHPVFVPEPDAVQEKGCVVTHEELRRVLDREIQGYIHLRAKQQHDAYRRRLGATPCLAMVVRGECVKAECQFQHLRPEMITVGWFNARVRLVLREIQILHLNGFHPKGVILHWVSVLYSILHPPSPQLGSIASLDLGDTPESKEGLRVLRDWVWQACDKLLFTAPYPQVQYIETFIPEFMPVCTMAYDFDFEQARAYVPRTRMHRYGKWPSCLTRPGPGGEGYFIVRDFVQFLQGDHPHSLTLGTLYLKQILVNRIPVDVGPFCDAVERLCGSLILAYRFKMGCGTLHGVTLPRSWFIGLSRLLPLLDKNTSHIPRFVKDTIEFLRRMDSQRELYNPQTADTHQFKYNGSRLIPFYASLYIARICFCLCLMGYNIYDDRLRYEVLQAIHGLQGPERVHGVYRQYAEAPDWRGLESVLIKSLSDSTLDEMVLLLYSKAPKYQGWVSRHVRTVMYESVEEIPGHLRAKATGRSDIRTPADPPPGHPTPEGQPVEPENDDGQQRHPEEDVLNASEGEVLIDNGGQEEASASSDEIQAALRIEAAYHRAITRKKEVLKGIDATRARLWSHLHRQASSMEWTDHRQYKLLMEGPLVHVLVCLDGIKMFADHISRVSKEKLRGDCRERLEEFIEMSDRSSDLQRTTVVLQTELGPSSSLHERRDVRTLKGAVMRVGRLIDRLEEFSGAAAMKTKEGIKEDWKLGWDGIVKGPVSVGFVS